MEKRIRILMVLIAACTLLFEANAQNLTSVSGNVINSQTKESVSAVSVTLKNSPVGAYTDERGNFKFTTVEKPPFTLVISSIGYTDKEVEFTGGESLQISISPNYSLGQEIVVAASRLPESYLTSPVSIERVNSTNIRNSAAANYYDMLGNLKGVDLTTSSITFKTPSTRGFNGSGNLRFNQLVDGMDNTVPALNFSVGNVIGLTELDVDNMELLPGASSALYGSGGLNGTLLITSKDPFKYQGFSFQVKQGVNHISDPSQKASPYYDWQFRWGKKVSDKFAFKIGGGFLKANDWHANDTSNLLRNNVTSSPKPGTRATDPNYDGVNVYGDEASASMSALAQAVVFGPSNTSLPLVIQQLTAAYGRPPTQQEIIAYYATTTNPDLAGLVPFAAGLANNIFVDANGTPQYISRTGYQEAAIVDYNAYNVKVSGGLYYFLSPSTEASLTANWGLGTSVYTGADRYSLKNFRIGQYKLEVKNPNWFVRAYTTQENSGDSYASTLTALSINSAWKDNSTWFAEYVGNYSGAVLQGMPSAQAHAYARGIADVGRYLPGTPEFDAAFNKSITTPISGTTGSQFADKSSLYELEGQWNLTPQIKVLEVLVGANDRLYRLNSKGTIFNDVDGPILINDYGAYVQLQKGLINDILKLSVSGRYDKSKNYKGHFTPRATASVEVAKNNTLRLSYQEAYRFPDNQAQYINIVTPGSRLIGGLPEFETQFNFKNNPVYTVESVVAFRATGDPQKLVKANFETVQPETVQSFEVGYRGLITSNFLIDAYFYSSKYKDFIARTAVARGASGNVETSVAELMSPFTSANYSFVVNSPVPVKAFGWGLGLEYQFDKGYRLNGNVYSDELHDVPPGLITFFNTPKIRYNIGFANANLVNGFGFHVNYKWQDKVDWQGTFAAAEIPAFGTVDLMLSYKLGKSKNLIKLGGTNLFNNYYRNAFGNPYIGGLYYVSFGYNVF